MRDKRYNNSMHHKGVWSDIKNVIIMALIILVSVYLLWTYVLHGGAKQIASLQSCGSLATGRGECKETCDKSIELGYKDFGCEGVKNWCCIRTQESMSDLTLPATYGSSQNEYDFIVEYVGIENDNVYANDPAKMKSDIGDCAFQNSGANTILRCTQGTIVTFTLKIGVKSTGSKAVSVQAYPVRVRNGDQETIRQLPASDATAIEIGDPTLETTAPITITAAEAIPNVEYKFYPYVLCSTDGCKSKDTANKGILRTKNDAYIQVKFVDKI
jgi:hypothetical protein